MNGSSRKWNNFRVVRKKKREKEIKVLKNRLIGIKLWNSFIGLFKKNYQPIPEK